MSVIARLLNFAGRTCGVASDEVPGGVTVETSRKLSALAKQGRVFTLRVANENGVRTRYFTTEGLRDAYARENPVREPLADTLRRRLKQPGSFRSFDFPPYTPAQVGMALTRLRHLGEVHTVTTAHKTALHFGDKTEADSFLAYIKRRSAVCGLHAKEATAGPGGFDKDATVDIPKHVKVQVCPPYTPRFTSLEPIAGVHGGNQRGRVPELPAQAAADWAQALAALRQVEVSDA